MRKLIHALIPAIVILAIAFAIIKIQGVSAHTVRRLAVGTKGETIVHIIDSNKPGPTVMLVGGIHGNEPAGSKAALKFMDIEVKIGKLIIIPEANKYGLLKSRRTDYNGSDLNRDFPRTKGENADTRLSRDIWNLVKEQGPDYIIDLHEGYAYHKLNSKSVGQSIISSPNAKWLRNIMVNDINKKIAGTNHDFSKLTYPAKGSLARAGYTIYDKQTMIIETCNKVSLKTRVNYHVAMVKKALKTLRML